MGIHDYIGVGEWPELLAQRPCHAPPGSHSGLLCRFYDAREAIESVSSRQKGALHRLAAPANVGHSGRADKLMIGLLQRVKRADVVVDGTRIAEIGPGLAVLVAVERGDSDREAARLLERLLAYRVFPDDQGRMNLSLSDVGGEILLVPQFTLAADTSQGNRPGFSRAAPPEQSEALFLKLVHAAEKSGIRTAKGHFGAAMDVSLTNVGPVTFWLRVAPP